MGVSFNQQLSGAGKDLVAGALRYELWVALAWRDVLARYRRSKLGSSWIVLSMLIVAPILGMLYGSIMKKPTDTYIPYVVVGFTVWAFLQAIVVEGCQVFIGNAAAIKEIPCPASVHIYRLLCRNFFVFLHNTVAYIIIAVFFGLNPFPEILYVFLGLFLLMFNGMWVGLLLGVVTAKSRDIAQLIANIMRLSFFVTPIIWYADDMKGARSAVVELNPFYYFISIIREPLLGGTIAPNTWLVVIVITVLGWSVAIATFSWAREKMAFWL